MKRLVLPLLLMLLAAPAAAKASKPAASPPARTESFGRFGSVALYGDAQQASQVVLFFSGDGGWNQGVVEMAKRLGSIDALVVGIDVPRYFDSLKKSSEECAYPAGDLESLSQYIQKKLERPHYTPPILVGYSSGATLAYATLAQAPAGTFKGAISLGFCPDLEATKKFCKGSGLSSGPLPQGKGILLEPAPNLEALWIAFQGEIDKTCDAAQTERFVKQVPGAEIVLLPKVGHGFSVSKNWLPQLEDAYRRMVRKTSPPPEPGEEQPAIGAMIPGDLKDLPLVEVPAVKQPSGTLAVLVSGDGGWVGLDRNVSKVLAERGIPVIGLNSLAYFWKRRTPEEAGKDLERIMRHYLAQWHCDKALLLGYSRGADVVPFMASRLPDDLRAQVRLVVLMGPDDSVDFEFHLSDWLGSDHHDNNLPVLPEIRKLDDFSVVCFYGEHEDDSLCPALKDGPMRVVRLSGGHHFSGDYEGVAERILQEAER
ncbi:MAG TPA: AcvB/VirJ family lysyl-phosphatidylglycerol hydrolase [Candidatus Polarisedimenticolia bacterium]|nr:AcvB/VirJ family lysyl-phosphatidylglycerol hydrolase [Candidatus Polarisedimenticolia bacterium]